jgi:YidC/Oxa1 family membrane protein insertase
MLRKLFFLVFAAVMSGGANAAHDVSTETLRLTFSDSGQLESAIACFPSCSAANTRLQQFADDGLVVFDDFTGGEWVRSVERSSSGYTVRFTHSSGASAEWTVPAHGYRVELDLDVPGDVTLRSGESFRPREAAGFGTWLEQSRYLVIGDGDVTQVGFDDESEVTAEDSQWLGYRNRYWAFLAAPPGLNLARLASSEERQDASVSVSAESGRWSFYLGPIEPVVLEKAAEGLGDIMYAGLWFWLRWICLALFHLLAWIKLAIPSWGLAIMVMSLAVNILMTPLSRIADRFQQQVNETEARLAPELQRIKKNHKGQEQSEKILALYKAENVHPLYSLKSMMGVAVVIPVFIGAFDMLAENIHLLNTSFLWIADMSRPDSLFLMPFRLPFFGADFNLLPFLMTGLSFIASALHNPLALNPQLRRKQVINMVLLAVLFFGLFYTFPAGMVLYWTTNNLISVIKSLWAKR